CGFLEMTPYQPIGTGAAYTYSNLGFALAATAAQRMSGEADAAFVDLMHKNVFKPLGMTGTTYFGRTDIARLPLGYRYTSRTAHAPVRPGWPG
ncbi:serine hydrolase, partial [Acinetobacter baumannii]